MEKCKQTDMPWQPGTYLARLEGPSFEYLMTEKSIVLGRNSGTNEVDIYLGQSSLISRKHLEIFVKYRKFYIFVHGKNGVYLDGKFQGQGYQLDIPNKCSLQFPMTGILLRFQSLVDSNEPSWIRVSHAPSPPLVPLERLNPSLPAPKPTKSIRRDEDLDESNVFSRNIDLLIKASSAISSPKHDPILSSLDSFKTVVVDGECSPPEDKSHSEHVSPPSITKDYQKQVRSPSSDEISVVDIEGDDDSLSIHISSKSPPASLTQDYDEQLLSSHDSSSIVDVDGDCSSLPEDNSPLGYIPSIEPDPSFTQDCQEQVLSPHDGTSIVDVDGESLQEVEGLSSHVSSSTTPNISLTHDHLYQQRWCLKQSHGLKQAHPPTPQPSHAQPSVLLPRHKRPPIPLPSHERPPTPPALPILSNQLQVHPCHDVFSVVELDGEHSLPEFESQAHPPTPHPSHAQPSVLLPRHKRPPVPLPSYERPTPPALPILSNQLQVQPCHDVFSVVELDGEHSLPEFESQAHPPTPHPSHVQPSVLLPRHARPPVPLPSHEPPPTPPAFPILYNELQEEDRPPYTFSQLIAQVMSLTKNRGVTRTDIHMLICRKYPYFRDVPEERMMMLISHNLSKFPYFVKFDNKLWGIEPMLLAEVEKDMYKLKWRYGTPKVVFPRSYKKFESLANTLIAHKSKLCERGQYYQALTNKLIQFGLQSQSLISS